jgi:iron complex transport system substrate-binding protein
MSFPKKIICLTEETTELFYLLGEEDRIAGITVYTVRPPRAKEEKPKVSAFISGNIKKIKSLNPDLIIGFSDIQAGLAHDLIKEGLNVYITNQRSIQEIFNTMMILGSLVGRSLETNLLINGWKSKLAVIENESQEIIKNKWNGKRPKVFFQEWNDPIITGIQWVSEIIEICGGEDAFSHLKDKSLAKDRIILPKDVVTASPDIIIGSWCGKPIDYNWFKDQENWDLIPAIQNDRNYEIDSSIILQPGPALFLEGIDQIKKYIHSFE